MSPPVAIKTAPFRTEDRQSTLFLPLLSPGADGVHGWNNRPATLLFIK
jgi:hypothetical protein